MHSDIVLIYFFTFDSSTHCFFVLFVLIEYAVLHFYVHALFLPLTFRWPEFCDYFAELTVCRLLDDGMPEAREQGWLASAFNAGQAVAIENYARTRVELCAYQEVSAQRGESAMRTMIDIGLVVLKCPVATVDEAAAAAAAAATSSSSSSFPRGSNGNGSSTSGGKPRSYGTLVRVFLNFESFSSL